MKAVVGLGNPGSKYSKTRHNLGFRVLAELARRYASPVPKVKFESEVAELHLANENVLLMAPQTYMNNSGRAVQLLVSFYKLPLEHLLVICDDFNLETGRLRLRLRGSAGGQKGLADIIHRLGSENFPRLRIGIGRPPDHMDPADYVLSRFRQGEHEPISRAIEAAADGAEKWVAEGAQEAMNFVNAPLEN